jgi:predicted nicotinamide N-methyase
MPGYQTHQATLAIRGAPDLLIRSLLDTQQFDDPLGEAAALGISSATWPLFGVVWPSGLQLAAWMAGRPLVPGERMLEVGCGLALGSLVAHRRGAAVTASDCHPLAACFLARNTSLNGLQPLPYRHGNWSAVPGAATAPSRPPVEGRFGLIMGSDVLYERDDPGHLQAFIERHALPRAEVLIVDPNRGNRVAFNRRMARAGFRLEECALAEVSPGDAPYRGRMLRYRR